MMKSRRKIVILVILSCYLFLVVSSNEEEGRYLRYQQHYFNSNPYERDDHYGIAPDSSFYGIMEPLMNDDFGHHEARDDNSLYQQPQTDSYHILDQTYTTAAPVAAHYNYPVQQKEDYGPPPKKKKPQKEEEEDDFLWELFFGKKKKKKTSSKPSQSYGEPPKSYGSTVAPKHESKEFIFKKMQVLAITATALLICLGGGILLAPLLIGGKKGRRLSFLDQLPTSSDDLIQLAERVLRAIQGYQLVHE